MATIGKKKISMISYHKYDLVLDTVNKKSYEYGLCFVGFYHGLVPVDFTHILQDYFPGGRAV